MVIVGAGASLRSIVVIFVCRPLDVLNVGEVDMIIGGAVSGLVESGSLTKHPALHLQVPIHIVGWAA